ncbi:MAG TPA: hypothetical protein VFB59_01065 [Candidatus Saccharimonadales bacterium]|nr:hypothetical protein [Candidatus Saccharimonadales bacterium]
MNVVFAMLIIVAGYGAILAFMKQLDKISQFAGNVGGQMFGRAQKALSDYRSNTMKQRRQEAIEDRRKIPFGRTMRRMHLAGQAGNGGFIGRQNRQKLAAAEQGFLQKSAQKRLEEEGGAMSGDDDAMALAMDEKIKSRGQFIKEYEARTGRDGEEAAAQLESRFGAEIGTGSMVVAAARARWASVSAYNDFNLDTQEGVNAMYQQMMEDAAKMVVSGRMSVTDVVSAMKKNTQRADISAHSFPQMMAQVASSAERLKQVQGGAISVRGRVMNEQTGVVEKDAAGEDITVDTGQSVRVNKYNKEVGRGVNLISNSEIDAWQRGALEYAGPGALVAGRTETVRVLGQHMKRRLDRAVAAQKQAEVKAAANPNNGDAQAALLRSERELKRQLAAVAGRYDVMAQISPENARYMAQTVLEQDIDMGAAQVIDQQVKFITGPDGKRILDNKGKPIPVLDANGNIVYTPGTIIPRKNIQQLIEDFRNDDEFRQFRREYGYSASAQAQQMQAQQARNLAQGGQPGTMPPLIPQG